MLQEVIKYLNLFTVKILAEGEKNENMQKLWCRKRR
jgi:hypothetical protein